MPEVRRLLAPDDFYNSQHRRLFELYRDFDDAGQPIDYLSIADSPEIKNCGGAAYLSSLCDSVMLNQGVLRSAVAIVKRDADRRGIIRAAQLADQQARNGAELDHIVNGLQGALNELEHTAPACSIEQAVLSLYDFASIEIPERQILLHPWLAANGITYIVGWRGTGKTWLGLSIADAVNRGVAFGPWHGSGNPVKVLYLDSEMAERDMLDRFTSLGIKPRQDDGFFLYSNAHANRQGLPMAHLANDEWRQAMKALLIKLGVRLFVIDNLTTLSRGIDENSKQDYDPINNWLLELRFSGIGTVILHHTNKAGEQRGTSSREDNIDCSILLKAPHDFNPEDGARFIASFSKHRVNTKDLPLVSDTEFRLVADDHGRHVWTWGSVKAGNKKAIVRLLGEGLDYSTIQAELGLSSKGYITKIKQEAIKTGWLTAAGKLTQSGYCYVAEG